MLLFRQSVQNGESGSIQFNVIKLRKETFLKASHFGGGGTPCVTERAFIVSKLPLSVALPRQLSQWESLFYFLSE